MIDKYFSYSVYLPWIYEFIAILYRSHTKIIPHSHTRLNFAQYDTSKNCQEKQKSVREKIGEKEHISTFENDT